MKRRTPQLVGLLAALVLLAAPGCKKDDSPEARGASLFKAACARCHGDDATGGIKSPETGGVMSRDLTNASWQESVTDEELRQVIRNGRGKMPPFGSALSIDKIDTVVKYMRTLKAAKKE